MAENQIRGLSSFADALLNPDAAVPDGVINPDGAPATRRFNVYRNNVIVSLIDALAARYPVVQKLVGEEFFAAMAREFILKNPPDSPVMLHYGTGFQDFVADFPPVASLPYLADVARLETARRSAYHAEDATPLDPAKLQSITPEAMETLRFQPHPASYLIKSAHAAYAIWYANHADAPLETPLDTPQAALITRPAFDVLVTQLPDGGGAFFGRLLDGGTLAEASEQGMLAAPHFDLAANLTIALQSGVFADIT